MNYAIVNPSICLSYGNEFEVSEDLWNDLSHKNMMVKVEKPCLNKELPSQASVKGRKSMTITLPARSSRSCFVGTQWCGVSDCLMPLFTLFLSWSEILRVLSISMIVKHSIRKFWNYKKDLMIPLCNFGNTFVILHIKSIKMKLIGNFSMKDFNILFIYLRIHIF